MLFFLLLAISGLLGAWLLTRGPTPDTGVVLTSGQPGPALLSSSTSSRSLEAGERAAAEQSVLQNELKAALAGQSDHELLGLIRKAQHDCPEQNDTCLIRAASGLPAAQQAQLRDILQHLPLLAGRLGNMPMSMQQTFADRLAAIHAARVEIMGEENARRLFGKEEALLGYQATLDHFIQTEAAKLPLAERLAQAETLRQQALGPYRHSLAQSDGERQQQYRAELALSLLDAKSEQEQAQIKQQVLSRYFGAEQAARQARDDSFDAAQRARANDYAQEKQQIMARYAGRADAASAAQRDQELNALRRRLFPDSFQQ